MTYTRVVVVDDHVTFAQALAARISVEPDLQVVAVAASAEDAERVVRAARPDIVTVDINLGADDGVHLTQRLHEIDPSTLPVVVSCIDDPHVVTAAVRAGALAWVAKDAPAAELIEVLRGVVEGQSSIPPHMLRTVLADLTAEPVDGKQVEERLSGLSVREREVLQLMVDGLDARAMSGKLYISVNTARTHTQNVLRKLGVHSGLEAVSLALRMGMRSRRQNDIERR